MKVEGKGMELMLQITSKLHAMEKGVSYFLALEQEGLNKCVPKKGRTPDSI